MCVHYELQPNLGLVQSILQNYRDGKNIFDNTSGEILGENRSVIKIRKFIIYLMFDSILT
jgi:hypothetical protein